MDETTLSVGAADRSWKTQLPKPVMDASSGTVTIKGDTNAQEIIAAEGTSTGGAIMTFNENWNTYYDQAMANSGHMILVITERWAESRWCRLEHFQATEKARDGLKLIYVIIKDRTERVYQQGPIWMVEFHDREGTAMDKDAQNPNWVSGGLRGGIALIDAHAVIQVERSEFCIDPLLYDPNDRTKARKRPSSQQMREAWIIPAAQTAEIMRALTT